MKTWQANKIEKNGNTILDRFAGAGYPKHKWKLIRPLQKDGLVEVPTPFGRSVFVDGNLNVYSSVLKFYRKESLKWGLSKSGLRVAITICIRGEKKKTRLSLLRLSRYLFGDKNGFTCDAFNFKNRQRCDIGSLEESGLISPKFGVLSSSVKYKKQNY